MPNATTVAKFRELQQKVTDLQSSLITALESREDSTASNFDDILDQVKQYK